MPVAVRNLMAGPTVFSSLEGTNRIQIEWSGKGDPNGEDVQEVPDDLLFDTKFRRALSRGVLVRVDQEEAEVALSTQSRSFSERQAADATQAQSFIDPSVNNDLVSMPCQGPGGRGTGECGAPVPVREKKADEAPVLCPQHASLASEFVQVETGDLEDKGDRLVAKTKWVRTVITARETSA